MKLVANLVLCALAYTAVADAASFRRVEACDGGDPEPTPAPTTTVPATTVPATTTPVTTTPAPETTAPVTTTPAPETTAPVTTTPAPETTAPATTPPATPAPAPVWDLTTPYDRSGPTGNCDGYLRLGVSQLDETDCVPDSKFSFFDGTVRPACIVCMGTYDVSLDLAPFPLCNNKPVCGRIGDLTDLTQGEVSCLIKANGDEAALTACDLGNNAVIPTPAPQPSTPAPETSAPTPTTPAPTFPVTNAPIPTPPTSYDMDTPYDRSGFDCEGIGRVKTASFTPTDCIVKDTFFSLYLPNRDQVVEACLACPGTYDASTTPALCNGKPICGRIGEYYDLTQTQLQCLAGSNGSKVVVEDCAIDPFLNLE